MLSKTIKGKPINLAESGGLDGTSVGSVVSALLLNDTIHITYTYIGDYVAIYAYGKQRIQFIIPTKVWKEFLNYED